MFLGKQSEAEDCYGLSELAAAANEGIGISLWPYSHRHNTSPVMRDTHPLCALRYVIDSYDLMYTPQIARDCLLRCCRTEVKLATLSTTVGTVRYPNFSSLC